MLLPAADNPAGAPRGSIVRAARVRPGIWIAHALSLLFLLIWGVAASFLPDYLLPGPVAVLRQAAALLTSPPFLLEALFSIWHIAASIAVAVVIGMALALMVHFLPVTRIAINGRLNPFLSSFSTIGWVFLSVIWFGLNDFTVIFVVAATLLPFALSNLRAGLEELDQEMIEMARSFGRRRARLAGMVILPLMVPYIFATLRICLGVAWKVMLTAELFGGTSGLGHLISRARAEFDTPAIFSIIVVIVLFVYASDKFVLQPIQLRLRRNYAVA
jgi:NitT/TauT family transport system permease protein/sulfonate transport system permease protein